MHYYAIGGLGLSDSNRTRKITKVQKSTRTFTKKTTTKTNGLPKRYNFGHLSGQDKINAKLKSFVSDEGKAEKGKEESRNSKRYT